MTTLPTSLSLPGWQVHISCSGDDGVTIRLGNPRQKDYMESYDNSHAIALFQGEYDVLLNKLLNGVPNVEIGWVLTTHSHLAVPRMPPVSWSQWTYRDWGSEDDCIGHGWVLSAVDSRHQNWSLRTPISYSPIFFFFLCSALNSKKYTSHQTANENCWSLRAKSDMGSGPESRLPCFSDWMF